jgi:hypothetical protein
MTGLCRKRTIPTVIAKLSDIGLCGLKDGKWTAREPNDEQLEWWRTWKNPTPKRWQDKVTYFRIYRPSASSEISLRQSALFSKILSWPNKLPSYYATCLGFPRRTAFTQLSKLRSLGLVSCDGCRVPESIPDLWLSKPVGVSVIAPVVRRFFNDLKDGWFMPGVGIQKIEQASEALASHFGHTSRYLRRYWADSFKRLAEPSRIEVFVREAESVMSYVIANGRTRKYLKTTTDLVIKQIQAWPRETNIWLWHFDPTLLFKSL